MTSTKPAIDTRALFLLEGGAASSALQGRFVTGTPNLLADGTGSFGQANPSGKPPIVALGN
ncbi:MAG: hypothetical protein IPL39_05800 [Opitutaceae bacterium]|nr:hypothetical protein [Opitutaceae bacterium]